MDILLKKEEYGYLEKCFETGLEECVGAEFSLPEYMPEILRIVKSTADVKINSCRLVGERVTVDGDCELRMIYTGDDGSIYSFSQTQSFTRYCENEKLADALDVSSRAFVNYVNCRATSPKKAEIKAGIIVNVSSYKSVSETIAALSNKSDIEEKCIPVCASSLGCYRNKAFSMSDTVETENVNASSVLCTSSYAVVTETKKIGNKILIKGDAVTEISFVTAKDKNSVEHIRHSMPINQILEIEGMEEKYSGCVSLSVGACDVIIKNDSSGDGRAFDIALLINAETVMWEKKEYCVIADAYSVKNCVELEKEKLVFFTDEEEITDTFTFSEKIDVSKIGASSVLCMTAEKCENTFSAEGDKFSATGTVKLSFILKNTAGETVTFEKMTDYTYKKNLPVQYRNGHCIGAVTLCTTDCTVLSSAELEIRGEMSICAAVFNKTELEAVCDIKDNGEKKNGGSAVTVYFPCENEELWDIAKKYNTTVRAIAEENELDTQTTDTKRILFIPTV